METYRYWDVLEHLPDGWSIDCTAGSPYPKSVFITNGKSAISGKQKRAILKFNPTVLENRIVQKKQLK